jgi:hypothetical protein
VTSGGSTYGLDKRHFEEHLQREELPDLSGFPLPRRSSHRLMEYLAETELERRRRPPRAVTTDLTGHDSSVHDDGARCTSLVNVRASSLWVERHPARP